MSKHSPTSINAIAVIVGEKAVTFYDELGSPHAFEQGDVRLPAMLKSYQAQSASGKEVRILELEVPIRQNVISNVHKHKPKFGTRFFIAAKAAWKAFLGEDGNGNQIQYSTPEETQAAMEAVKYRLERLASASKESLAEGASNQILNEVAGENNLPIRMVTDASTLRQDETIVAVTSDGAIDGVEAIHEQLGDGRISTHAEELIRRLTKVAQKRRHSAAELLEFIATLHLPPLPDGSFIGYKRLYRVFDSTGGWEDGTYVDVYTEKVYQRIGDFVTVDEQYVNADRSQDCAQGLHVGSQKYMGGYASRNERAATVLVRVYPEDVISVPSYDKTKLRTCRYQIIGEMDKQSEKHINNARNLPEGTTTVAMMNALLGGVNVNSLGVVHIGGAMGTDVTYRILETKVDPQITLENALKVGQTQRNEISLDHLKAEEGEKPVLIDTNAQQGALKQGSVRNAVKIESDKKIDPTTLGSSRSQQANVLWEKAIDDKLPEADRQKAAEDLLAFKKKAKVSWTLLGLEDSVKGVLDSLISNANKATPAPAPVTTSAKPAPAKPTVKQKHAKQRELNSNEKKAIALKAEGKLSVSEIARKTGMSRTTLRRLLDKQS